MAIKNKIISINLRDFMKKTLLLSLSLLMFSASTQPLTFTDASKAICTLKKRTLAKGVGSVACGLASIHFAIFKGNPGTSFILGFTSALLARFTLNDVAQYSANKTHA